MKNIVAVLLLTLSFFELKSQTLDWALQLGGNYFDGGLDLEVDNQGNVFVATIEWDTTLYYQNNNETSDYKCKIAKYDSSGNFIWEVFVPKFYQMSIDSSGNIYALGIDLIGNFDYDPSNEFATITPLPGNPPSTYIVKFNSDGTFAWLRNFQAGYEEYVNRNLYIKCDNEGNVIVSGPFDNILRIDFGVEPILIYTENYWPNIYIFKLDSLGNLLWQKNSDAPDNVYFSSNNMEVDELGNLYITGKFNKRLDFDLNPNNSFVVTADFEEIIYIDPSSGEIFADTVWNDDTFFIAKYNSNAEIMWVKKTQHIVDLKVGSAGDIYCLGYMYNEQLLDFDPGPGTFIIPNLGGNSFNSFDIYMLKLNLNGEFIWAKGINNPGFVILRKLSIDENENLYFTGRGGRIDFDPSNAINVVGTNFEHFIAKYDSSGNYYWANFYNSTSSENWGTKIITKNNFIYSVGQFNSPINLDPEQSNLTFNDYPYISPLKHLL